MLHVPLIVFLLNDSHLLVRWLEKNHKNITQMMVKSSDESHGRIRKKSPEKTNTKPEGIAWC